MKVYRENKEYNHLLVKWLRTQNGTIFALEVLSQLIGSFEKNHKGTITGINIDDVTGVVIDIDELKELAIK